MHEQIFNSNFYVLLKKEESADILIGPMIISVKAADEAELIDMDISCL